MSLTLPINIARKYLSDMFIETGTYKGDGIQTALDAGYRRIVSIEADVELALAARKRFETDSRVFVATGDSAEIISALQEENLGKVTFWLDAHSFSSSDSALLRELDAIGQLKHHHHNILIDDMRCLTQWDLTREAIIEAGMRISPKYRVSYETSLIAKDDIMVFSW